MPNLEKFIDEVEGDPKEEFLEPNRGSLRFYQSSLTIPLIGDDISYNQFSEEDFYKKLTGEETYATLGKKKYVLGLFCIDAPEKDYFREIAGCPVEDTFDFQVMNQLAHNVFSMIRSYYAVKIISTRRAARRRGVQTRMGTK